MRTIENPAARASAHRVLRVKAFSSSIDSQNPTESPSESLAVRAIARRFSITISHARVVCELAQIGGAV